MFLSMQPFIRSVLFIIIFINLNQAMEEDNTTLTDYQIELSECDEKERARYVLGRSASKIDTSHLKGAICPDNYTYFFFGVSNPDAPHTIEYGPSFAGQRFGSVVIDDCAQQGELNVTNGQMFQGMAFPLWQLKMTSSNIRKLPAELLNSVPSLEYVDFYDNKIECFPDQFFKGLHKLKNLTLSKNKLTFLPLLDELKSLEILEINGNNMKEIDLRAFKPIPNYTKKSLSINAKNNPMQGSRVCAIAYPLLIIDLPEQDLSRNEADCGRQQQRALVCNEDWKTRPSDQRSSNEADKRKGMNHNAIAFWVIISGLLTSIVGIFIYIIFGITWNVTPKNGGAEPHTRVA